MLRRTLVIAAPLLAFGATPLAAQAVPAACQPLFDAQKKEIMTPHHAYSTETAVGRGGKGTQGEVISTGGQSYILYYGKWRRSPMSPQRYLDQIKENIASARKIECHQVGSESVSGVPATVYTSHNEGGAGIADAKHWVATGTGMLLRTEEDLDTGGGAKRHISIRYDYANVTAPAGVK
jgi:hypothetical protein